MVSEGRDRPLGKIENAISLASDHWPMNMVAVVHLQGPVSPELLQQALDRAIARLKPMHREVLVLRDIEGLTAPEVSEALGLIVQAVKSRLHRARRLLQKALRHVAEERGIFRSLSESSVTT